MQLKLLFFAAILLLIKSVPSYAEPDDLKSEFYVQKFDNNIIVFTPVVSYEKEISTSTNAAFKFTADFVGQEREVGVGVDSVSGASRMAVKNKQKQTQSNGDVRMNDDDDDDDGGDDDDDDDGEGNIGSELEIIDVRKEVTLNFNHKLTSTFETRLGYDYSIEKDYVSHTPSMTFMKDFFMKNTTLAAGFAKNIDTVSGKFMDRSELKDSNNYYLSLTQILTPYTISQFAYSIVDVSGFMATGTKKVSINATDYNEIFPETRRKNIVVGRLSQYLPMRSSLQVSYRYYTDDWKIRSNTTEAEVFKYIGRSSLLRFNYRYYTQTSAFFYKESYLDVEEFITAETQMGSMITHLYGARFIYDIDNQSKMSFKYERYSQSVGISGNVFMLSVNFIF